MSIAIEGLEAPLNLDRIELSPQKEVVRRFYKEMWDRADLSLIPGIFHPDFTFRGSLGPVLVGHNQFADYVRWVTGSLQHYTSDILLLVEEGDKVCGKVRFHGLHKAQMFGRAPTGRHVWWLGAPIFTFRDGKVCDLWVLGDIHGLMEQLDPGINSRPEFDPAR